MSAREATDDELVEHAAAVLKEWMDEWEPPADPPRSSGEFDVLYGTLAYRLGRLGLYVERGKGVTALRVAAGAVLDDARDDT